MKKLFLYDFDGTITYKDSLFEFLKYTSTSFNYVVWYIVFTPLFVLAKVGILSKSNVKEWFISVFLKGKTRADIHLLSQNFLQEKQPKRFFRPNAIASIEKHLKMGDVFIVSASLDIWLDTVSEYLGVGLICTEAEFVDDVFTGRFKTPNCNYKQKPIRVKNEIDVSSFDEIFYYGDSNGDLEMKPLVTHFYLNQF